MVFIFEEAPVSNHQDSRVVIAIANNLGRQLEQATQAFFFNFLIPGMSATPGPLAKAVLVHERNTQRGFVVMTQIYTNRPRQATRLIRKPRAMRPATSRLENRGKLGGDGVVEGIVAIRAQPRYRISVETCHEIEALLGNISFRW